MRAKRSNPPHGGSKHLIASSQVPRNDGGIASAIDHVNRSKRDTTDERSNCNWRRVSRAASAGWRSAISSRRARRFLDRATDGARRGPSPARARRQPLCQLSGAARLKTRRRFPRSATTRSISSGAVRHSPRWPRWVLIIPCLGRGYGYILGHRTAALIDDTCMRTASGAPPERGMEIAIDLPATSLRRGWKISTTSSVSPTSSRRLRSTTAISLIIYTRHHVAARARCIAISPW